MAAMAGFFLGERIPQLRNDFYYHIPVLNRRYTSFKVYEDMKL